MWNQKERDLRSQLSAGESLLWSGEPKQGLLFRPSEIYIIPSSLLVTGFAVLWNVAVWNSDAPSYFRLFGVLPIVYAIYWLIVRFFVDAWQRSKTFYGVTNERVIMISGIFSRTVKSINLATITDISLSERPNASGTITFGPEDDVSDWRSKLPFETRNNRVPTYPTLDSIPNAKRVYDIIRDAQRRR